MNTTDTHPQKCTVCGCSNLQVAKGFCGTHYKRNLRHGSVLQTRPATWGLLEKHPMYHTWRHYFRKNSKPSDEWLDFHRFVEDVGDRPSPKHRLSKRNKTLPIGPDNWYWQPPAFDTIDRSDKRAYANDYARKSRLANPNMYFDAGLRVRYGITIDDYVELHETQAGVCAVCGSQETSVDPRSKNVRRLAVDHDHATGKVRGLLCKACNTAMGSFKDDITILNRAVAYLKKHSTQKS